jgi:hypothetical protein
MNPTLLLPAYIHRQALLSSRTFGPYTQRGETCHRIERELAAIRNEPCELAFLHWTNASIYALDGLWRSLAYSHQLGLYQASERACDLLNFQYEINEARDWPFRPDV